MDSNDGFEQSSKNIDRVGRQSKEEWKVYNAISRYQIRPDLVKWYYPDEEIIDKQMTKDGADRHYIDDIAIRESNEIVLKDLVPEIIPEASYFQPQERPV